jgi:hypothetical protein
MHYRLIVIIAVVCVALSAGGCASRSHGDYEEVLMPLQTGSVFHRRTQVKAEPEKKTKKKTDEKKKEDKKKAKADAEPTASPAPEEESTPPPVDRFR